jgi:mannobiose 2-epimerase
VKDSIKHTYNQAFAIYALSSYYDATKDEEALSLAMDLYELLESRCKDEVGYLEAFDEFFHPVNNDKLSENGIIAEKTMNTLLHVFEAYTELYRVTQNEDVADKVRWLLDCFANKVYHPKLHRNEVFFDKNMNSILDIHSYGHDIEAAWLMDRGVEVICDREYQKKMQPITMDLANQIYHRAYRNHSLLNEFEKGVDKTNRIWWVQAEAIIGFHNAYEKSKEARYLEASKDIWNFVQEYVLDKRVGSEWFWEVDETGTPTAGLPIVEPWKCPYHNGRMCFEIIRRSGYVAS